MAYSPSGDRLATAHDDWTVRLWDAKTLKELAILKGHTISPYHVAFSSGGSFRVSEIWDSMEQFEAFGQRLMPILAERGIELAGPPEVIEVHNIIKR